MTLDLKGYNLHEKEAFNKYLPAQSLNYRQSSVSLYLGSFPQQLGQSDHVGFKLSLVGPLTSHFQP